MIKSKATNPSIIFIGSIAAKNSVKYSNHSAYSGTKGAVLGLMPAIAKELGPYVRTILFSTPVLSNSVCIGT